MTRLRWVALTALCVFPSVGQRVTSAVTPYVDLLILGTSLPAEIKAGSLLTVKVTAAGGGCTTYDRMLVTRSAGRLELQLQMLRPKINGVGPLSCTADLRPIPVRYLDPRDRAGENVTVIVNGKQAGVVRIIPK